VSAINEADPRAMKKKRPPKGLSAAQLLVRLCDHADVFADVDGSTGYITLEVEGHHETWAIRSSGFKGWLRHRFFELEHKPPPSNAVEETLGVLEGRARFATPRRRCPTALRIAGDDRTIYVDLGTEDWSAIQVTPDGWGVVTDPPVKFRRALGGLPLPIPKPNGDLGLLRRYVNVRDDDQWSLLLAWLVATMRPRGPYPVLVLLGEQGTAKSTTQKLLRALVDPNKAPLRSPPSQERDVMIAANSNWMLGYDNLSEIEPWLSDAFCCLATGGAFGTRRLYSDDEETLFEAMRPVMLNGIDAVVERSDLLDRALILDLPIIPLSQRRDEAELWTAFGEDKASILGGLLDAVTIALSLLPGLRLESKPRMADFALWATAAEPGLGLEDGAFLAAYDTNRASMHALALEAAIIAKTLQEMIDRESFKGTMTELLEALNVAAGHVGERPQRPPKGWPANPAKLGTALRRIAPNLRALGYVVTFSDEKSLGSKRKQVSINATGKTE
jgi:hypothetical protein